MYTHITSAQDYRRGAAEKYRIKIYTEAKFLKNLARGQEGGPQAKLPGAYCGIFKDRYSPQTKGIFSPGPYPISFQGAPRNEIKNWVKNRVLNE